MSSRALLALGFLATLAGCPSDPENPTVLFLAPDGSELAVRLQPEEPEPF